MTSGKWKCLAQSGAGTGIKAPKGSQIIDVDWLHAQVLVVFTDKQRKKVARQFMLPPEHELLQDNCHCDGMASVIYSGDSIPYFLLFLPEDNSRIVVHECTHMVHLLFEAHGIPVETNNTEAIAYMTDFLAEHIFVMFHDRLVKQQEKLHEKTLS